MADSDDASDKEAFNARWLQAWTDKDVPALLECYADDVVYRDPQVPGGLVGQDALGAYLRQLFDATPPMTYTPDEVWATHDGWCGRWVCRIDLADGAAAWLRGFDLVVLDGDRIALNEVYTHTFDDDPRIET
jgi:ketosteroid isomerase-like protein